MVRIRVRSWSPVALLLGLLLVVGALAGPADASIKRTVSLRSSVSVAGAGTSVTFAGTLTSTPVGSTLKLQIKLGASWLDARTLKTTTAAGAYRASVVMPKYLGKYYFRAFASAGGGRTSATSATVSVTVLRRVSAALKPSTTTVSGTQPVTFNGHVSPCVVGSTVTLQRYAGSSWTKVAAPTLSSACTFARVVHPTATTSYRLSVPVHGSYAPTYSAVVRITYTGPPPTPPTITTTSPLPGGTVGTSYSQTLTETGQAGTWSKTAGALPNGLLLNGSTGEIAGTPTTAGTFGFTVRYTETGSGLSASKVLSITVVSPPPVITTTTLPPGVKGAAYSQQLAVNGNAGTWSLAAPDTLPVGITLSSSGLLSGTPSANVSDDYEFTVTFTETAAQTTDAQDLVLHVSQAANSPAITTTNADFPPAQVGTAFTFTLQAEGTGSWAVTRYSLPPGLTLSSNPLTPGQISGTPTAAGDYTFQVKYTNLIGGGNNTKLLTIHVAP